MSNSPQLHFMKGKAIALNSVEIKRLREPGLKLHRGSFAMGLIASMTKQLFQGVA